MKSVNVAKKTLTQEDSDLFRQMIGKVKPVQTDKPHLTTGNRPRPYPKAKTIDLEQKINFNEQFETEQLSLEDSLGYFSPGLQKNVLKKLRKGYYGVDAEIDLHGLSSHEAKQQLLRFLHFSVEDGARCIHIIHGKGYRSPNKVPVLKNKLNLWLRQHQDVLAFCSASPKDGGTGAVYVLLKLSSKFA